MVIVQVVHSSDTSKVGSGKCLATVKLHMYVLSNIGANVLLRTTHLVQN